MCYTCFLGRGEDTDKNRKIFDCGRVILIEIPTFHRKKMKTFTSQHEIMFLVAIITELVHIKWLDTDRKWKRSYQKINIARTQTFPWFRIFRKKKQTFEKPWPWKGGIAIGALFQCISGYFYRCFWKCTF